jgi:hypothetical protein
MGHVMSTLYRNTSIARFAICDPGNGFSVEDRKTGQRVGWFPTYAQAVKARDKARDDKGLKTT